MIPSFATAGVLTAPSGALITSGYIPGNPLAAQHLNWYLNHLTLELNNLLTLGGVVQNSAVDTQVGTAVLNVSRAAVAILNSVVLTAGVSANIPVGSGTVVIKTGSTFTANLPSAASAYAASFEVDIRNENAGATGGSGSVKIAPLSGDYLAGYLNGTWEVTEQGGHVRLRPSPIGGGNYGWLVTSCDGTVYRNVITTQQVASITFGSWTNKGGSLTLGPGVYELSWSASLQSTSSTPDVEATLSTANNSESDVDFTARAAIYTATAEEPAYRRKRVIVPAVTTYYLNCQPNTGTQTVGFNAGAGIGNTIIEAKRVA